MKTKKPLPTKLIRIETPKGVKGPYYLSQFTWASDEQIKTYKHYGYRVTLVSDCQELIEIYKMRRDRGRPALTDADVQDAIIDLHLMGKSQPEARQ